MSSGMLTRDHETLPECIADKVAPEDCEKAQASLELRCSYMAYDLSSYDATHFCLG
ncbi:hypothetical protein DPMN_046520 [Dreissena polymorpha]|uniref:Uncharacterized protein n=1 Tax=Dreissena polymorpha TaxID=45954 RepID=A0A9D4D6Z2_DREPO|nr:hypothetical protein DPMN_046520 [Dreissena polymorpha]